MRTGAGSLSRVLRRHRTTVVSGLALALVASGMVAYAVSADGFRAHDPQLNDGGIWVTSRTDGYFGRVNKPVGQLDGGLYAALDADLDVVQEDGVVLGLDRSAGTLQPIDPATVTSPEDEVAAVPGGGDVHVNGGTVAVTDPRTGGTWAQVVDPAAPVPVTALDSQADPVARPGGAASMTVTERGDVVVVSAERGTALRLVRTGDGGIERGPRTPLPGEVGDRARVTSVGEAAAVLDPEAGRLWTLGGGEAGEWSARVDVPVGSVLQQPGQADDEVLVASGDALLAVPVGGGEPRTVAEASGGRATAPVRLGACVYAAWSGGRGTLVRRCGSEEPTVASLDANTSDLVFRVNRGEIVLNDRVSGAVWDVDAPQPVRLDNWDAFKKKQTKSDEDEERERETQGDRRPPKARPDTLGARPGRTTVLHPLDNDSAPEGRLLSIRSVEKVSDPDAEVTISPDGQTAQISLPSDARGRVSFVYYVDDGRADVTAHATVTVPVRTDGQNEAPGLRQGFEPRTWTVPAGGVLDVPVLADWRDRADGDPLAVTAATAVGGERSGAAARPTASGRVRFDAPAEGGPVEVEYVVSDGVGEDVRRSLELVVQDPKDRRAHAGVAEPDVVTGHAGEPITIRPLANDLPGSDPLTPDARLEIAGRVRAPGGAEVTTDLVQGTLRLTSSVPRTYFLDYDTAYGNAPLAHGQVRVDVRAPRQVDEQPVAMPDNVLLDGQSAALVDVLANDTDPAGGMLSVQVAEPRQEGELEVAVVDSRWVRIASREAVLTPNPQVVRYQVTNGTRSASGEVVVSQRPAPEAEPPVTEKDTVTVRAGASVAVPVLDNDFSPSGGTLSLLKDAADESSGRLTVRRPGDEEVATGQAFVTGNFVRYVAPPGLADPQVFTVRYQAVDEQGLSAPGKLEVSVVPADRPNQPPEPPALEGRVVAGDSVTLRVPSAGTDPDGDAVTVLGLRRAPSLGRVVRLGANSVVYQAFPGSAGTEEFTYQLTDSYGAVATGTARVAVSQPELPQPPLAVDDPVVAEPGRRLTVDFLANDHIAAGDSVTARLVDAPAGVRLDSAVGPLRMTAPERGGGRVVEVVYEVSNGLDSSRGTVTLRTRSPYNNPPVAFDAFGPADDGDSVSVDVLATAYDPDGRSADLRVAQVVAPKGVAHRVGDDGTVTVARGRHPMVVPFRVEDADGGATTASLYVPPAGGGLPYLRADGLVELEPGGSTTEALGDYVADPAGGPVRFTLAERIWASPAGSVSAQVSDAGEFEVSAARGYRGPGAVSFEVTTGESVDDPAGRTAVLTVPVQVGEDRPVLRCPTVPVEIPQGTNKELDVGSICHVWTTDPRDADDVEFTADWQSSIDGLDLVRPEGRVIEIGADEDARPGVTAELLVRAGDSEPATFGVRVLDVGSPELAPSLAPIRIADMKAGESRTVDLAPYLTSPLGDEAEPTLVEVAQESGLDVTARPSGASGVTITTGEQVSGTARFRVVMSDVADSRSAERRVTGRLELEVLSGPDRPAPPVPGRTVRSQEVHLTWRAPEDHGSPIDSYELRDDRGGVTTCGTTSCDVTGLVNGEDYRFQVRAHNQVGWSEWSGFSAVATPDARPGQVGPITMTDRGDGTLSLRWTPPTTKTSAIKRYWISYPGAGRELSSTAPSVVVTGLDNNTRYSFTVVAENDFAYGLPRASGELQPIGTPQVPQGVAATGTPLPGGDAAAVKITWAASDPNGPGPVQYTVLRNGRPLPGCTRVQATECVDGGVTYDGSRYSYTVTATNNGGAADANTSAQSAPAQFQATGTAAPWGDWTVAPTGQDAQARASFTVPSSRGAQSLVTVLVDGAPRIGPQEMRGAQSLLVPTPDNDRLHSVSLRVCNEAGSCSDSAAKSVQTYGPFRDGHILQLRSEVDGPNVRWYVEVDGNGDPAEVRVNRDTSSSSAVSETFRMSTVDVQGFWTQWRNVGYSTTEVAEVQLSDSSPARRMVNRGASATTSDPPRPTARIWRYEKCGPTGSADPCYTGNGGVDCVHESCGRIAISTDGWKEWGYNRVECGLRDDRNGAWWGRSFTVNDGGTNYTTAYYGFPNSSVTVRCGPSFAPADVPMAWFTYPWPDN